nr:uncharacterized protein LOC115122985 [Oncorhynchus nerka]
MRVSPAASGRSSIIHWRKERRGNACSISDGMRSAQEFALNFRTLAASAGWNERAMIDHYRCSLREDVLRELACRDTTLTLDQLVDISIQLDNLLATRKRLDRGPSNPSPSTSDPTPMELGAFIVEVVHSLHHEDPLGLTQPVYPKAGIGAVLPGSQNVKVDALSRMYDKEERSMDPTPILPASCLVAPVVWEVDADIERALRAEPTPTQCPVGRYQPVLAPWHQIQIEAPAVDEWFWHSEETWDVAYVRLQRAIRRQKASTDRHLNPSPSLLSTPLPPLPGSSPSFSLLTAVPLTFPVSLSCSSFLPPAEKRIQRGVQRLRSTQAAGGGSGGAEGEFTGILGQLMDKGQLSLELIRANITELMAGGVDTTAVPLQFALYELGRNPAVQEQVRGQVRVAWARAGGDAHKALQGAPLLKGLVKETLRLYPVGITVQRYSVRDIIIQNYHIPAGTCVQACLYPLGRSRDVFQDPERFDPGRWGTQESGEGGGGFRSLAFGFGARQCVGRRIAENEMQLLLMHVSEGGMEVHTHIHTYTNRLTNQTNQSFYQSIIPGNLNELTNSLTI